MYQNLFYPYYHYNIINYNIKLMVYIGTTNIILIYNPIFIFSSFSFTFLSISSLIDLSTDL